MGKKKKSPPSRQAVQQIKERLNEVEDQEPRSYNMNLDFISDATFKMQDASTMKWGEIYSFFESREWQKSESYSREKNA